MDYQQQHMDCQQQHMDCQYCGQTYDKHREAYILPQCKHHICYQCLSTKFKDQQIQCQQCHIINHNQNINQFLINNLIQHLNININIQNQQQQANQQYCSLHDKVFEAYCYQDHQLVCIDCIIQDHKNHDVKNLQQTQLKEMQNHQKIQKALLNMLQDNQYAIQKCHKLQYKLNDQFTNELKQLEMCYQKLIEQLYHRKMKIESQMQKEKDDIMEKISCNLNVYTVQTNMINQSLQELKVFLGQDIIEIMKQQSQRQLLFQDINKQLVYFKCKQDEIDMDYYVYQMKNFDEVQEIREIQKTLSQQIQQFQKYEKGSKSKSKNDADNDRRNSDSKLKNKSSVYGGSGKKQVDFQDTVKQRKLSEVQDYAKQRKLSQMQQRKSTDVQQRKSTEVQQRKVSEVQQRKVSEVQQKKVSEVQQRKVSEVQQRKVQRDMEDNKIDDLKSVSPIIMKKIMSQKDSVRYKNDYKINLVDISEQRAKKNSVNYGQGDFKSPYNPRKSDPLGIKGRQFKSEKSNKNEKTEQSKKNMQRVKEGINDIEKIKNLKKQINSKYSNIKSKVQTYMNSYSMKPNAKEKGLEESKDIENSLSKVVVKKQNNSMAIDKKMLSQSDVNMNTMTQISCQMNMVEDKLCIQKGYLINNDMSSRIESSRINDMIIDDDIGGEYSVKTFESVEMDQMLLVVSGDQQWMNYQVYSYEKEVRKIEQVEVEGCQVERRSGFGIVKYGKKVLLIGGYLQSGQYSDEIIEIELKYREQDVMVLMIKQSESRLQKCRSSFGYWYDESGYWIVGGKNEYGLLRSFEKYEYKDKKWRVLKSIDDGLEQIGLVGLESGELMMVGGSNGMQVDKVQVYEIESDRWMDWGCLQQGG